MAAARGEMSLLRRAIRVANLDATDENGRTALHCACEGGHVEVARALVIADCDREARDNLGRTPLMVGAWCGHVQVRKPAEILTLTQTTLHAKPKMQGKPGTKPNPVADCSLPVSHG